MILGITTKYEVLDAFLEAERNGVTIGVDTLVRACDLSEIAAIRHLERLWQQRLISPDGDWRGNPRGFVKNIPSLRFRLTDRGRERILWREREDR